MKRLALLLVALLIAGCGVFTRPDERSAQFERLLRLAEVADAAYDQEPAWDSVKPQTREELDWLVISILWRFREEGLTQEPDAPSSVSFAEFGPDRSAVAGRYRPSTHEVFLNIRYLADPSWDTPYLWTLVHELVHAQGEDVIVGYNEAATEILAAEIVAAFANSGWPGFRAELLDHLRRHALRVAWWMAYYGGTPQSTVLGADPRQPENAEWLPQNGDWLERVRKVQKSVFSPDELRTADQSLRYKLGPMYPGDPRSVEDAYRVRPLAVELATVCDEDPTLIEDFRPPERDLPYPIRPVRLSTPRLDDLDYVLREIGFC